MTNLEYAKNNANNFNLNRNCSICAIAYCAKHSVSDCDGVSCSGCEFFDFGKCVDFLLKEHKEPMKLTRLEYDLLMDMNKTFVFIRVTFLRKIKEKGHYKGLNDTNLKIKEILENCEIVPDDYFKE